MGIFLEFEIWVPPQKNWEAICPKWQRAWNRSSSGRSLYQHIPIVPNGKYKSTLSKDHEARLIRAKTRHNKFKCIFISLILLTVICVTVAKTPRTLNMLSCIAPFTQSIVIGRLTPLSWNMWKATHHFTRDNFTSALYAIQITQHPRPDIRSTLPLQPSSQEWGCSFSHCHTGTDSHRDITSLAK